MKGVGGDWGLLEETCLAEESAQIFSAAAESCRLPAPNSSRTGCGAPSLTPPPSPAPPSRFGLEAAGAWRELPDSAGEACAGCSGRDGTCGDTRGCRRARHGAGVTAGRGGASPCRRGLGNEAPAMTWLRGAGLCTCVRVRGVHVWARVRGVCVCACGVRVQGARVRVRARAGSVRVCGARVCARVPSPAALM